MSSSHCWQSNKNEKVEKGKNYQRVNEGKMIDVYNYMRWRQHLDAIERKKLMNKKKIPMYLNWEKGWMVINMIIRLTCTMFETHKQLGFIVQWSNHSRFTDFLLQNLN